MKTIRTILCNWLGHKGDAKNSGSEHFLAEREIEVSAIMHKSGAERYADSEEELVSHVNEYLLHPERDQENRAKLVKDYVTFTDGLTYKRTADVIQYIIEKEKKVL